MRYMKNYIAEFSQYNYKIGHNETKIGMFYDKLPYPISSIINEKYIAWLNTTRKMQNTDGFNDGILLIGDGNFISATELATEYDCRIFARR